MVSNIFLKFSELSVLPKEEQPFCDNYGSTASSVLTEFLSMEDIINASPEDLVAFLGEKSRNRISDPAKTADLLQKAARDSYRLDKCLYDPINISLASSFNCIDAFKQEIKVIDKAILKTIAGLNPNIGKEDAPFKILATVFTSSNSSSILCCPYPATFKCAIK